jgi:translocation and assembly module TamB
MRRAARILLRVLAVLVALAAILSIAVVVVLRSDWFREEVRKRIVSEVQKASGARVELGSFRFDWTNLNADVTGLVLHGKESAGEPPLVQVESARVGLRLISALERKVDLASLTILRPHARIVFYADGSTNFPVPEVRKEDTKWQSDILNLAVKKYEVVDGTVEYDDRKTPLNLRGEHLDLRMSYDPNGPAYVCAIKTSNLRTALEGVKPFDVNAEASCRLETTRIVVQKLTFSTRDSRAELEGTLEDLQKPHGKFQLKATGLIRDVVRMFGVPVQPVGSAAFNGTLDVDFSDPPRLQIDGHAFARGAGFKQDGIDIKGAAAAGDVHLKLDGMTVSNLSVKALGSSLNGKLSLANWRRLHLEGEIDSVDIATANSMAGGRPLPWNGSLSGTFQLDEAINRRDLVAQGVLAILPAPEGNAIDGMLDVRFDQAAGEIKLGNSHLHTRNSSLDLAGTLGDELHVRFHSADLDDVLPALSFLDDNAPRELPLKLAGGGVADGEGDLTGKLDNLSFEGDVHLGPAELEGHPFDRFDAHLETDKTLVKVERALLARGNMQVSGSAQVQARQGSFDNGALSGSVALRGIPIEDALKEAKTTAPVSGILSGSVNLSGTVRDPQGSGDLDIRQPVLYGQPFDRLHTSVRVGPGLAEISGGQADWASARVLFSGAYAPAASDWQTGDVRVQLSAQNVALERLQMLQEFKPPLAGLLQGTLDASGHIGNGGFALASADAKFTTSNLTVDQQPVGSVGLTAQTKGDKVELAVSGKLRDTEIQGTGSLGLDGDRPGSIQVRFAQMDLQTVHKLAMLGGTTEQQASTLPFDGSVEGSGKATFTLKSPKDFQAELTLDKLKMMPRPSAQGAVAAPLKATDIELHNTKPVLLALTAKGATVRSGEFAGPETTIQVTGSIPFSEGASADLAVRGDLNLTILRLLSPDLRSTGSATVQATVRGALRDPAVNGRMELKRASLEFEDLPNTLDNAEGVVLFDRNRATIEKLTADTGGGRIMLSGFLDFGSSIVYRLQADAKQVRVRWPEELSTTFDAKLALNGTPDQSTLSGTLTLNRATVNSRGDLGSLFASGAKPVPTMSQPNDVLRGMQFDVRIESGSNFEFQTSLTRDVQAEVDLRLRGTPLRPGLVGDISVNQGEVEVLGNRYSVNRGDIHFLNAVKIEPTLDMELETKAHGVTVNVKLSGTMDKLNVNYSSDPPLQSNEIIALLAVGRDPSLASGLGANSTAGANSGFGGAGLGLLGEAASEQLSSRVQRFIGSSRVKIDPTLTGIDNLPQARLTIEQQVSRDITLTYITNLNRTQEQIVRIQWDFNRSWSAVAVRDSNGLFGIDFQFRKRF